MIGKLNTWDNERHSFSVCGHLLLYMITYNDSDDTVLRSIQITVIGHYNGGGW